MSSTKRRSDHNRFLGGIRKMVLVFCGLFTLNLLAADAELAARVANAVKYTLDESKLKSVGYEVSDKNPVASQILYKDGRNFYFYFENSPGVWIHTLVNHAALDGEYKWVSDTPDAGPPHGIVLWRTYRRSEEFPKVLNELIAPERLASGDYTRSDSSYEGARCDKITIHYPDSDAALTSASTFQLEPNLAFTLWEEDPLFVQRGMTPELFRAHAKEIRNGYFATVQLWVDQTPKRPFIYAMKVLNRKGQKIYTMNWGKLEFLDSVDPAKFEPPPVEILPLHDSSAYRKAYIEYFSKTFHKNNVEPSWWQWGRWFSGIGGFFVWCFNALLDGILNWGGTVALGVAGLCIAVVIYAKIAERCKNR